MSWSHFFETYAGPMATILASLAALGVTVYFNRVQASIARSQAATAAAQKEIAFDKLKLDLFEKRYEIYQAAKAVIGVILSGLPLNTDDATKLRRKMDEARFFFSPDILDLFERIYGQVPNLATTGYSEAKRQHRELNQEQCNAEKELLKIYAELTKLFGRDLRFEQLTKS